MLIKRSLVLLCAGIATAVAQESSETPPGPSSVSGVVGPEVWMSPRHGETFLQHESVAPVVRHWLAAPEGRLMVHYPGGEGGELWGLELKAWLVALGIASDAITLVDDYDQSDAVQLVYSPSVSPDAESAPVEAMAEDLNHSMQESP